MAYVCAILLSFLLFCFYGYNCIWELATLQKFVFCVVGYEILHTHVVGIILTPWML